MSNVRKVKQTAGSKDAKQLTTEVGSGSDDKEEISASPPAAAKAQSLPPPPKPLASAVPASAPREPSAAKKHLLNDDIVLLSTGFLRFYIDKVEEKLNAAKREAERLKLEEAKKAEEAKKSESHWLNSLATNAISLVSTVVDVASSALHSGKNMVAKATGHVHEEQNFALCKLYETKLIAINSEEKETTTLFSLQREIITQIQRILADSLNWNYSTVIEPLFAVVDLINRLPTLFPEDPAVKEYAKQKHDAVQGLLAIRTKLNDEAVALFETSSSTAKKEEELYAACRDLRYWGHKQWYLTTDQAPKVFSKELFGCPVLQSTALYPHALNTKAKFAHTNYLEIFLFEREIKTTNDRTLPLFLETLKIKKAAEAEARRLAIAAEEAKKVQAERERKAAADKAEATMKAQKEATADALSRAQALDRRQNTPAMPNAGSPHAHPPSISFVPSADQLSLLVGGSTGGLASQLNIKLEEGHFGGVSDDSKAASVPAKPSAVGTPPASTPDPKPADTPAPQTARLM